MLRTNYDCLKSFLEPASKSGKLARWRPRSQAFTINGAYIPEANKLPTDAMSRFSTDGGDNTDKLSDVEDPILATEDDLTPQQYMITTFPLSALTSTTNRSRQSKSHSNKCCTVNEMTLNFNTAPPKSDYRPATSTSMRMGSSYAYNP